MKNITDVLKGMVLNFCEERGPWICTVFAFEQTRMVCKYCMFSPIFPFDQCCQIISIPVFLSSLMLKPNILKIRRRMTTSGFGGVSC